MSVKPIKIGFYEAVSMEDYHSPSSFGVSCSRLTGFYSDPKGFVLRNALGVKRPESAAMRKGTAFHLSLEDFDVFRDTYIPVQTSRLTAKGLERFYIEHPGKTPIRQVDFDHILEMRKCFMALPQNKEIMALPRYNEASIYWQDEESGLILKCRPDTLTKDFTFAANFKTVDPYHLSNFNVHVSNLFYHVSAAMTMEGIKKITGVNCDKYYLMCQTSKAPLKAFNAPITETVRIQGEILLREMINAYMDYLADPMKYQTEDQLIIDQLPMTKAESKKIRDAIPPKGEEYQNPFFKAFETEI
jgi:hypothetical protein